MWVGSTCWVHFYISEEQAPSVLLGTNIRTVALQDEGCGMSRTDMQGRMRRNAMRKLVVGSILAVAAALTIPAFSPHASAQRAANKDDMRPSNAATRPNRAARLPSPLVITPAASSKQKKKISKKKQQ